MTSPTRIRDALLAALRVRHSIATLEDFARQMALLAVNAKVASVRIGDHGRPFSVITQEITNASGALNSTVAQIRDLTRRWTRVIASALSLARNADGFDEALARCGDGSSARATLHAALTVNGGELDRLLARHPALVEELQRIAGDMTRALQIIDYIKIALLVESAHLPRNAAGIGGTSPFAHLAEEMHTAALRIREIAGLASDTEAFAL